MLFYLNLIYYIDDKGDEVVEDASLWIKVIITLIELGLITALIFNNKNNKLLTIPLGVVLFICGIIELV